MTMAVWTIGARLGPYVLVAPIGAGGMGEVWKARDTRLDRVVAVKRLKERASTRFTQEARAIAALNHPHICQIHDIGPDYMVLEYIEGRPLKGPQAVEKAVRMATQIADALDSAHRKGVVHRDLKPANILVTSEGVVKLLDFGLAKLTERVEVSENATTRTLIPTTDPRIVMGTAPYMSPEQVEGKALDARSDVFSFGAVLYELVSGRQAFRGENSISTMAAILHSEPVPLDAPAALQLVVKQCLAKALHQRYQTMTEVRAALESISTIAEETQASIAVLPFANVSRDADDEYFSEGLAEEIINALTQVSGLKVIARTSAFAFKGRNEDIRKIAQALGVTTILEGSVRRVGNQLRVTVQLIHAADGAHLWAQRYDRQMTEVFAVQDEIAAAITGALSGKLTDNRVTRPHEPNLPAYDAFLKASHHQHHQLLQHAPEMPPSSEGFLKQAIALDPEWATPHSALAHQYFSLGIHGLRPLREAVPPARLEARNALELFPPDPYARAVLGAIAAMHDYDWSEAEKQFRLARTHGSLRPEVHIMYASYYLLPFGRFDEAIEHHVTAITQDPLNIGSRMAQLMTLHIAGRYDRAISEARSLLEFDDRNYVANLIIASAYLHQGKPAEAREKAEEAFRLASWHAGVVGFLAGLRVANGEEERAGNLIATMQGGMIQFGMVAYYSACSEIDAAIDWYERAIEQRHPYAAQFACAEFFKPLRSNPRWPKLARMMNLSETA